MSLQYISDAKCKIHPDTNSRASIEFAVSWVSGKFRNMKLMSIVSHYTSTGSRRQRAQLFDNHVGWLVVYYIQQSRMRNMDWHKYYANALITLQFDVARCSNSTLNPRWPRSIYIVQHIEQCFNIVVVNGEA